MYIPDKGDIVWLDFEPSSGKEITKRRPAFVISRKVFNEHTRLVITAPITSTIRGTQLEVALNGVSIQGAILVYQIKSLDYESRSIELIEKAPEDVVSKVTEIAQLIIK